MIDRERRVVAAHLVESFRTRAISIVQLDDRWPLAASDGALIAIQATLLLAFYNCEITDHSAIPNGRDRLLDRCVAFLRSREQYAWPVGAGEEKEKARADSVDSLPEERFREESTWPFAAT